MDSLRVASLLDPQDTAHAGASQELGDILKTASTMEKLGKALESGQAKLDDDLRELFGGDETDDDIARHNQLEEEYLKLTGQPGI